MREGGTTEPPAWDQGGPPRTRSQPPHRWQNTFAPQQLALASPTHSTPSRHPQVAIGNKTTKTKWSEEALPPYLPTKEPATMVVVHFRHALKATFDVHHGRVVMAIRGATHA